MDGGGEEGWRGEVRMMGWDGMGWREGWRGEVR